MDWSSFAWGAGSALVALFLLAVMYAAGKNAAKKDAAKEQDKP